VAYRWMMKGRTLGLSETRAYAAKAGADEDQVVSRRRILTRAAGLAAVGVAGGTILAETVPSRASAQTAVQQGALAPAVVVLTDAPNIAVDASRGNDFRLTLGGDRTIGDPTNPAPGQQIILQITQGTGGPFTITWGLTYEFSSTLPQPTLSTAPGQTDLCGFIYNAATESWLLAAFLSGFGS
jgi:hypothetical protein